MKSDSPGVKAVVVLSGGQDSATCLALAVRKYGAERVAAITFRYGQRHALETRYARRLARRFGVTRHKVVSLGFYGQLTSSALMSMYALSTSLFTFSALSYSCLSSSSLAAALPILERL